jgi:hypothetical protein
VGSVIGVVGAFTGLFLMYIIPVFVYVKRIKISIDFPHILYGLENNKIKRYQNPDKNKNIQYSPRFEVDLKGEPIKKLTAQEKSKRKQDYIVAIVFHSFIILIGLSIAILQFF